MLYDYFCKKIHFIKMQQLRILSLLGLFIVSLSPNLKAQSDWLDGFMVKLDGDTIRGKVGYQGNASHYSNFLFKEDKNSRLFSPNEVLGYGIDNIRSYSSQVVKDKFVEVVATGPLSLYRENKTLFIQTENGEIYSLTSKQQREIKDGVEYLNQSKKWKSILYGIVSSCDINPEDIKSLSFNEKNVLKQIKKYNSCKGSTTTDYRNKTFKKTLVDYGILIGRRNSELDISSVDGITKFVDGSYKTSDYVFGILFDFRFPNLSDRISLELGLNHQSSLLLSKITRSANLIREIVNRFDAISVPISLKIIIKEGSVPLFLQTGITLQNYYNTSSVLYTDWRIGNVIEISERDRAFDIERSRSYFWSRVGLSKSFKGLFKITLAADIVFPGSGLLNSIEKFSPFKQSGISLILAR